MKFYSNNSVRFIDDIVKNGIYFVSFEGKNHKWEPYKNQKYTGKVRYLGDKAYTNGDLWTSCELLEDKLYLNSLLFRPRNQFMSIPFSCFRHKFNYINR